jgi:hypothetical protein
MVMLIMCSWLPPPQPPSPPLQVRRDASRALSEFKRTHEQDALEELKGRLGEEQWEGLQQVTSSASYFV